MLHFPLLLCEKVAGKIAEKREAAQHGGQVLSQEVETADEVLVARSCQEGRRKTQFSICGVWTFAGLAAPCAWSGAFYGAPFGAFTGPSRFWWWTALRTRGPGPLMSGSSCFVLRLLKNKVRPISQRENNCLGGCSRFRSWARIRRRIGIVVEVGDERHGSYGAMLRSKQLRAFLHETSVLTVEETSCLTKKLFGVVPILFIGANQSLYILFSLKKCWQGRSGPKLQTSCGVGCLLNLWAGIEKALSAAETRVCVLWHTKWCPKTLHLSRPPVPLDDDKRMPRRILESGRHRSHSRGPTCCPHNELCRCPLPSLTAGGCVFHTMLAKGMTRPRSPMKEKSGSKFAERLCCLKFFSCGKT